MVLDLDKSRPKSQKRIQLGCRSIFPRVLVPKSFYSERRRSLFQRVIIQKIFIPKGRYSGVMILRIKIFGVMTFRDKNKQTNKQTN